VPAGKARRIVSSRDRDWVKATGLSQLDISEMLDGSVAERVRHLIGASGRVFVGASSWTEQRPPAVGTTTECNQVIGSTGVAKRGGRSHNQACLMRMFSA
jgi:type II secretory pathway component PulK